MFGNLGEMAKMFQKAKELQGNMKKLKEELAQAEYGATSTGGMVTAVVSGDFQLKQIAIRPEAMDDRESLEGMVFEAVTAANNAARMAVQEKMADLTGGKAQVAALPGRAASKLTRAAPAAYSTADHCSCKSCLLAGVSLACGPATSPRPTHTTSTPLSSGRARFSCR